jgi:hypothetical protein
VRLPALVHFHLNALALDLHFAKRLEHVAGHILRDLDDAEGFRDLNRTDLGTSDPGLSGNCSNEILRWATHSGAGLAKWPSSGRVGYAEAAKELLNQADDRDIDFRSEVVASGSGQTHAGLLVGFRLLGRSEVQVHGVCVRCRAPVNVGAGQTAISLCLSRLLSMMTARHQALRSLTEPLTRPYTIGVE